MYCNMIGYQAKVFILIKDFARNRTDSKNEAEDSSGLNSLAILGTVYRSQRAVSEQVECDDARKLFGLRCLCSRLLGRETGQITALARARAMAFSTFTLDILGNAFEHYP